MLHRISGPILSPLRRSTAASGFYPWNLSPDAPEAATGRLRRATERSISTLDMGSAKNILTGPLLGISGVFSVQYEWVSHTSSTSPTSPTLHWDTELARTRRKGCDCERRRSRASSFVGNHHWLKTSKRPDAVCRPIAMPTERASQPYYAFLHLQ